MFLSCPLVQKAFPVLILRRGGILVREGQDLKSPQTSERLSTGAELEELELQGERLHYRQCDLYHLWGMSYTLPANPCHDPDSPHHKSVCMKKGSARREAKTQNKQKKDDAVGGNVGGLLQLVRLRQGV